MIIGQVKAGNLLVEKNKYLKLGVVLIIMINTHKNLSDNTIIFISGASGVGKTSIARNILDYLPEILVVEQLDLVREAIRAYNIQTAGSVSHILNKQEIKNLINYDILMKSTSLLNINELEQQCKTLLFPLEMICKRLRKKAIPSIIEGSSMSFNILLQEKYFLQSDNMYFINLYASDMNKHRQRINNRSHRRKENPIKKNEFINIRKINKYHYSKTQKIIDSNTRLKQKIFNIDTTVDYQLNGVLEMDYISELIIKSLII